MRLRGPTEIVNVRILNSHIALNACSVASMIQIYTEQRVVRFHDACRRNGVTQVERQRQSI